MKSITLFFILILFRTFVMSQTDQLKKQTNLIFNGIYTDIIHHRHVADGPSPYELYDGFKITKVIQGNVDSNHIKVDFNYINNMEVPLKKEQEYRISLALSNIRIKELRTKQEDPQYSFTIKKDDIKEIIPKQK